MDFEKTFEEEFKKAKQAVQKPNLFIVGGTGVGKSSLLNKVFGRDVAKTGDGLPVTKGLNRYEPEDRSIVFYDTEGYETAGDGTEDRTNFDEVIIPEIERRNKGELCDQVHLVWYCISISGHKVKPYDLQNINYFASHNMKIAVVFTKCDTDEDLPDGRGKDATDFRQIIDQIECNIPCFETSATLDKDKFLNEELDRLIEWSKEALPNYQLREGFISSQRVSIDQKKVTAYKTAGTFAAATATTAGLNPLPVSDSVLIVPQQMGMVISISNIFSFGSLSEGAGALIKGQLTSLAGKQLATSLLKLLPGVGQAVNAVVAGGLTFALGAAMTELYAEAYRKFLDTGKLPDWTAIFSSKEFANMMANAYKNWGKK